jgi:hypothetical protein
LYFNKKFKNASEAKMGFPARYLQAIFGLLEWPMEAFLVIKIEKN